MSAATESRTVKISEASVIINHALKKDRPVMLWGGPGVGKSDLIAQVGQTTGREVIDVRLNLWEPTDIKGIPYYNSNENTMSWAPPAELPTDPDCKAILFLDELVSAAPAVQAAAYQLILNRRIGTYKLPKGVGIVAAGNRMSDKGVTFRMPSPLANRFMHLELRVDFADWLQWALQNNIHPDVVGYLSFSKNDLNNFDPKVHDRSFATPRSWSFVSEMASDEISEGTYSDIVAGCVGEGVGIKFMTHRKISSKLPNPTDILNGTVKDLKIKEISAMYSLTTSLCYELKEAYQNLNKEKKLDDWHPMCENFIQYMMDNFEPEMTIMGAHTALKTHQLPFQHKKLKNFPEFFKKYAHLVIDIK
jgi:AAA domain (dynein-related subfamily)